MLHQVKADLDKMLKAKNRALSLYKSMEVEMAKFAEKEKEYEDRLSNIGVELEVKSA